MTPESAIRKMRKEADRAKAIATEPGHDPGVDEWFLGWARGVRYAADLFASTLAQSPYL